MSGLVKLPVSWPITGGIATKNAPIMLKPGSALVLDNVRQERLNEWRTRPGNGQSALDDLPGANVPVIATEAPWGGLIGLCRQTDTETAARMYNPTSAPRWHSPPTVLYDGFPQVYETCSQVNPGIWSRQSIGASANGPTYGECCAEGDGYRLTAWGSDVGSTSGIQVALTTTAGASLAYFAMYGNDPNAIRPRCVYSSAAHMLVLVWTDGLGNINAARWDTTTGLQVGGTTLMSSAGLHSSVCRLDAIYYGGSTVTIVYRNTVDNVELIEFNPATNGFTVYAPGANCANALSLLPDPDVSGIRMVAVCTNVPEVRVVRINGVGVIQTNHVADTVATHAIAGCAYGAGVNWMIVYNDPGTGTGPKAVKRRNGTTTSAVAKLGTASTVGIEYLVTNAWREPGTDPLHYILVIADGDGSQPTYLEMALDYDNAAGTVVNRWTEPQARLVPLNAKYIGESDHLQQVFRTGTDRFVTCLARQVSFDIPADAVGISLLLSQRYAVDDWTIQYLNGTTYTNQNNGQGCQTQQCAYLPVGSLLQTATGQSLCSHGASSLPFRPGAVQSTGAGALTLTQRYSCVTTTTLYDEAGNAWESEPSEAVTFTLTGANNQITWTAKNTPFENATRRRTVKFWRTQGNGSEYFLLHEVTDSVANTCQVTFLDLLADTRMVQPISAEVQATITPAFSHIVEWNRRLYGVERDFPTRVRYSKPISPGLSPVFPFDFVVDTDDGFGPITGLAAMDDRLVVMKARATYVGDGNARDNAGNGSDPGFTRISSETGNIVGGPFLSTGAEVYMTSAGGVFRLSRSQEIDFVGNAIDLYLSMPLLQSQETVTGMVLSPQDNEVRIQTTHFRFVHDRVFNLWERDTGGFGLATVVMTKMLGGTTQCFFTSDGHLWIESADSTAPADAGTPYQGVIRSPWIRPTGVGGWVHFYRARAYGTVTTTATVTGAELKIFFDDDDTSFETFTPPGNIAATAGLLRIEARPQKGKITSFSLQLKLPTGDATVRLEQWWVLVAPKVGGPPQKQNTRWMGAVTPSPCDCAPKPGPTPLPLKTWIISKVHNAVVDTQGGPNQRDLLVKVKNALVASGQWRVAISCDGATVSTSVDLWTDWTKLLGFPFGVESFCVLKNVALGYEILLSVPLTLGWTEIGLAYSATGAFTGGTTTVLPTAADVINFGGNSWLGRFPAASPTYYAITWVASDGTGTRVGWFYLGHLIAWWQFDAMYLSGSLNTSSWATPFMAAANNIIFDPATDWYRLTANKFAFSGLGATDFTKAAFPPVGGAQTLIYGSVERVLNASGSPYPIAPGNATPDPNPWNGKHLWAAPMGMFASSAGSPTNFLGYLQDQWWTTANFNDGDTIDGGKFIIIGESILPYDGTLAPPIGGGASVDYQASSFYGRTTL